MGHDVEKYTVHLEVMAREDSDGLVALVHEAMNAIEAECARRTISFHFHCQDAGIDDGRSYFVWKHDGRVCGAAGLQNYLWGPRENVWLTWFAVRPEMQGRGVGTTLLHEVEELARRRGHRKFFVETYRHADFERARRFYEARGFSLFGEVDNYLPDGSAMMVYGKILT